MLVVVVQYFEMIAAGGKSLLKDVKMDGRHLGAEDGIILAHLFGKLHLFDGTGVDGPLLRFLFPHTDGGEERANPDSGSPQVVYFVDFQAGVDLA